MNGTEFLGMTIDRWAIFGLCGQFLFGARFLVQWISSEIKQESHIPIYFWYFSIMGGFITFIYAWHIRDPVFIVGQSCGIVVYSRNLILIYRKRAKEKLESEGGEDEQTS